ncbi:MAG: hypothetical protein WC595_00135 [Candidatus Nanoarchaeia archaeon]
MAGMELRLEMHPLQDSSNADKLYNGSYKFEVDVDGEKIPYVFCPDTILSTNSNSKIGFLDHDRIFVSKKLHPAQVPFVVLRLHYNGMGVDTLEDRFGKGTFNGLPDYQVRAITLQATLDYAKDFLRPEHMCDLIERFKTEPDYEPRWHDVIFNEVAASYTAERPTTALARREQQSLDFYVERVGEYVDAHHRNKFVKRSRGLSDVTSALPALSPLYSADITKADKVMQAIESDSVLSERIADLIPLIDQIATLHNGDTIRAGKVESRLLYLCSNEAMEKPKSAPLVYVEGDKHTNVYRVSNHAHSFFPSLRTRLQKEAMDDLKQAKRALAGVNEVVTKVNSKSPLSTRIQNSLQRLLPATTAPAEQRALVYPLPVLEIEEIGDGITEHVADLALTTTLAPLKTRDLYKALRVQAGLAALGISIPPALEEVIRQNQRTPLLMGVGKH